MVTSFFMNNDSYYVINTASVSINGIFW